MHHEPVDLVLNASWLIPIIPEDTAFSECSVAIHNGRIQAICPRAEADRRYKATRTIDLDHHVLLPGMINAHGHAAMSLLRGYADDLDLHTWLNDRIWPTEGQWVSEEFVFDGTELALAEMISTGTTCFSDMYFFPDHTAKVARKAGIRSQIAFPVIDFPTAWARDGDEYIHKGLALRDNFKNDPLLTIAFGPHAVYSVADSLFEKIAIYANELDTMVQIHLHESQQEVANGLKERGITNLQHLKNIGLLSANTQCVHMIALEQSDIELVADSKAHVIHCPKSNMKLGNGNCPITALTAHGVNVALGTDGAASNNSLDMFSEMQFASLLAKGTNGDPTTMSAHQSLRMATIHGARALGLENEIGSIEVGKAADLIAVDVSALPQQPLYNPASQLVYSQMGGCVSHNWVAGKCLLEKGVLTTLSLEEICQKAAMWRQKILA